MPLSDRRLLAALSRMPFVVSTELALIPGEPHATPPRSDRLLANGIAELVNYSTIHLPSSGTYRLTPCGMREAASFIMD